MNFSNVIIFFRIKNDKALEKSLNNFYGVEEPDKNAGFMARPKKVETSPMRNMQETNYSQFLKIQREMDNLKNKLKNGKFNPLTGEKY